MTDRIVAAAQGLLAARQENRIALLDAEIAPRDLTEAYAVHLELLDLLSANGGGPRIGWKVGFTNDAAQARMGAKEPVLAGLLGQHSYVGEAELASPGGKGLGVEAELAVRLRSPLSGPVSRQEAAAAIEARWPRRNWAAHTGCRWHAAVRQYLRTVEHDDGSDDDQGVRRQAPGRWSD